MQRRCSVCDQFLTHAIVEAPDLRKHVQRSTNGVQRFVESSPWTASPIVLTSRTTVRSMTIAQHAKVLAHQVERFHVPDTVIERGRALMSVNSSATRIDRQSTALITVSDGKRIRGMSRVDKKRRGTDYGSLALRSLAGVPTVALRDRPR